MFDIFKKGIWTENPVFVQALTLCPLLAMTTRVYHGLGMGIAYAAAMILTNVLISVFGRFIPAEARKPCYIVIIAGVVTAIGLAMHAYAEHMHEALGVFLPLIAVNCMVLGRAEAFASKNNPIRSALDGLAVGIGFAIALLVLAIPREILGNGTLFDGTNFVIYIFGQTDRYMFNWPHNYFMVRSPGAFITLGIIMGGANWLILRRIKKAKGAN